MAEELIDKYIDRNGIEQDTQFILGKLNEVYGAFQKLDGVKINLGGAQGLSDTVPALKEAKAGMDSLEVATKTVTDRIKSMNGQSKEFTQVLLAQTKAQKEAANASLLEAKARTENAKAAAQEEKASQAAAKAKANESKINEQLENEYYQLSKAYNDAALKAKNLYLIIGDEGNPVVKQAIKEANDIANVLKKADAAVGQFQRNVGNYKSAFDGLGFSFSQVGRELPSLAINFQTFALAISNNLPIVADEIAKARREIAALKAEGKETPSLFQRIKSAILSPSVALSTVIALFTVFAGKLFQSSDASKELEKSTDDLTKAFERQRQELNRVNQLIDDQTQLDLERIRTGGGNKEKLYTRELQGLKDKLNTEQQIQADIQARFKTEQENFDKIRETLVDIGYRKLSKKEVKALQDKYKAYQDELKASEERAVDLQNQIELRRQQRETERYEDGKELAEKRKKDAEDAAKDAKERADAQLQFEFDIKALEVQRSIDFNKEIADDESKTYDVRLAAAREFTYASEYLIRLRYELDTKLGKKTATELVLVEERKNDALIRLEREFNSLRQSIWEKFNDSRIEDEERVQKELEKVIDEAYKKFEAKRKSDDEKGKAELKRVLDERKELRRKLAEEEIQLAVEVADTVTAIFTAKEDREIAAIDRRIAAIDAAKQKEIEAINATVANRTEAAAQIAIVEARAQAEKEQLANRQKELERKKAQIQNLSAVANIAADTARGIMSINIEAAKARAQAAVLASNPITAPLAGPAFANAVLIQGQIPIIIATAAAQLARLIIPKYRTGKNADNYEGPAIVGDGGRRELHIREDGTVEITPDRPTLTYVRKRDIILPDAQAAVNSVVSGATARRALEPGIVKDDAVERAILAMRKDVVQAIGNQPKQSITANDQGMVKVWQWGANQTKYLNEQTNW